MMDLGVFETCMSAMGLEPRPQQVKLQEMIRDLLRKGAGVKFAQAGTGTGKSFVVLPSAVEAAKLTGKPSIVVCPNNSLINQYVEKDAPKIKRITGADIVYLKGRSNYVCANSKGLQDMGGDRVARQQFADLTTGGKFEWAQLGLDATFGCPGAADCNASSAWLRDDMCDLHSGHRSGCESVDDTAPWKCECKGPNPSCSCRYYCGAIMAKRLAETADVIITNGHVLTYNYLVNLWSEGVVQLLPQYGALFVDECHELESIARGCQSDEIKPGSKVYDHIDGLREWVDTKALEMTNNQQPEGLLSRDETIVKMAEDAAALAQDLEDRADAAGQDPDLAKQYRKEAKQLIRFVDFVTESDQHISIIELQPTGPFDDPVAHLKRVCVDTSLVYRDILTEQPSVLISGTIPQTDPKRLGVGDFSRIENVGHPFDYSKSRLVLSNHSPKDSTTLYQRATQAANAINAKGGGALILFTSWKDVDEVLPMILHQLRPEIASEVYVQSREDKAALKQDIEDFKAHGSAVLAGVASLWTGLDIPGDALRTVVIWKLPYGVPTLESKAIERLHGRDVYWDSMLCRLVQGIGRLVRTTEDAGTVFIADSRAKNQRWGSNPLTRHLLEFSK
jgi:ATP-dependent DNA helicase DinG